MPALNEEKSIYKVIDSLITGVSNVNISQILVADGGSCDLTRDIVYNLSLNDLRVKLIENPFRIQSHGLNEILRYCTADIILRADAHCIYDHGYVDRCVSALINSGARNVGGCQRFVANSILISS